MRTVIIGNSGSGKTYLANALSNCATIPVIHLDHIFWEPGGFDIRRSPEGVAQLVAAGSKHRHWLVEGVFGHLAAHFLADADRLIWLDLSWDLCEIRLQRRGSESKQHLGREQSEDGLNQLLMWAKTYYSRSDSCSYSGHETLFNTFRRTRYKLRTEAEVKAIIHQM